MAVCVYMCVCAHESPTTWTLRPEDTLKSLNLPSTLFETRSLDLFWVFICLFVLLVWFVFAMYSEQSGL